MGHDRYQRQAERLWYHTFSADACIHLSAAMEKADGKEQAEKDSADDKQGKGRADRFGR